MLYAVKFSLTFIAKKLVDIIKRFWVTIERLLAVDSFRHRHWLPFMAVLTIIKFDILRPLQSTITITSC